MLYLGQPYSDPDPHVIRYRYNAGLEMLSKLAKRGLHVFSPIVHCHEQNRLMGQGPDYEFWRNYDLTMIKQSGGMLVYKLPGFMASKGLVDEIQFARTEDLPVYEFSSLSDLNIDELIKTHNVTF